MSLFGSQPIQTELHCHFRRYVTSFTHLIKLISVIVASSILLLFLSVELILSLFLALFFETEFPVDVNYRQ